MKTVLETKRLLLREFTLEDTIFIVQLLNTPGWLQFIGDRNVKNEAQALAYLENGPLKSYRDNGYGLYAVALKNSKALIGMCGILRRDTLEYPDIGFAFLPDYMGKGYAFEAASATIAYAHQNLQLPTICAITDPANEASIRLLEKIGMSFIKSFRYTQTDETLLLYATALF
jgi:RimJ/RimL family protein N-acetyltransferase